jgi:peptidyl-prolyl cis-trans isomerase C
MKLRSSLVLALLASAVLAAPVMAQNAAVVNGKSIPKAKLDKLMEGSGQPDNAELRERARELLISRELMLQEASNRGLLANETVQQQLEDAKLNILAAAVFQDYVTKGGVTDEEIAGAYDKAKEQFEGKEYKVHHILVEKEADAKAILAKLKAGEKFEELAKAKSKDPGSAPNGGEMDFINPRALVPEFSKAMMALKKGETTSKPVKTQYGYHIIRLDDTREGKVPTLAELKPQLIQMLSQDQNWQRAKFNDMVQKLRAKAKVE